MKIKGEINPVLKDHMTFRAHGIRLDLHIPNPCYEETAEKVDEICHRVSALRRAIEETGLSLNQFEQTWGLLTEQTIYLYDNLKQHERLQKYWNKDGEGTFVKGWEGERDELSDYHIVVSFLNMRNEKDLPKGKIRSMIIWLYHEDSEAPIGNMSYLSKYFVF